MKISLNRAIVSLTSALDYVGVDEVHHAQRVALLAHTLSGALGWDDERRHDILYAAMLHDCGVSRVQEYRNLTETLEWDGAEQHCLRGEQFLLACPPLARHAPAVRWHHSRWTQLDRALLGQRVALDSNLIFLTDRLDVLLAPYVTDRSLRSEILWDHPQLIARLRGLAGSLFAPELVEALERVSHQERFWLQCDPGYVMDEIAERLSQHPDVELGSADALAIAELFARTVNSKSRYTLEHSTRVARIARFLGECSGFRGEHLDQLEIAALLHDIGKLRVPETIIDRPGPITDQERAIVKRHSYDTGRILRRVFPGLPIAGWAEMHHENLLGSGYPGRLDAQQIPLEARLIAIADIFQALSQERPYRTALEAEEVMQHLENLATLGRVDAGLTRLVRQHLGTCRQLACRD